MTHAALRPYVPADAPWLTEAHQRLYAEAEGFDDSFGPLVASILAGFDAGHDPAREAGWIAEAVGAPLGSIFCVRQDETTAKLRLFLLLPQARGQGLGRRMLQSCLSFAAQAGYDRLTLWTHESHRAACALYAATGFTLAGSRPVRSFGQDLVEQTWTIGLRDLAIADTSR